MPAAQCGVDGVLAAGQDPRLYEAARVAGQDVREEPRLGRHAHEAPQLPQRAQH